MKRSTGYLIATTVAAAAVGTGLWFAAGGQKTADTVAVTDVTRGELTVHSVFNGKIESRNVVTIMSKYQGNATVVELVPEGSQVEQGDVLVRFDSADLERDLVKLEKEYALAKSELDSLVQAKLPLELRELELNLLEARGQLEAERQYLADSRSLQRENLISAQEVKQQEIKVEKLASGLEKAELEFELTKEYLHPAALTAARTKLYSAEQALQLARRQLQNSTVRAPADGVVVYKPLSIGGEFRTVRVGDTLYPNQPFLVLPDMTNLVVHCDIPESELARVAERNKAYIRPLAYPGLSLPGTVETVGSVAQTLPARPAWQKYFHVTIGVDKVDPAIRPGMSVMADVVSLHKSNAVLIPRRAVLWDAGKAFSQVVDGQSYHTRELTLGAANDLYYEVIDGVKSGDRVLIQ